MERATATVTAGKRFKHLFGTRQQENPLLPLLYNLIANLRVMFGRSVASLFTIWAANWIARKLALYGAQPTLLSTPSVIISLIKRNGQPKSKSTVTVSALNVISKCARTTRTLGREEEW